MGRKETTEGIFKGSTNGRKTGKASGSETEETPHRFAEVPLKGEQLEIRSPSGYGVRRLTQKA